MILSNKRKAKALIRLRGCAGWSAPLLFTNHRIQVFSGEAHIRIYHECEVGIEQFILRITDWHHEAYQVMTNRDCEGRIFLSHPHTNNGFFFLFTIKKPHFYTVNPHYTDTLYNSKILYNVRSVSSKVPV